MTEPYILPADLRRAVFHHYHQSGDGLAEVFLLGVKAALENPAKWRRDLGMKPITLRDPGEALPPWYDDPVPDEGMAAAHTDAPSVPLSERG